jgi:hypothetical protein
LIARPDDPRKTTLDMLAWAACTLVSGSIVWFLLVGAQLCLNADNRSDLFVRRCESHLRDVPAFGFLIIALGYVLARALRKPWIRGLSLVLAFVPGIITWALFSV